MAIIFTMTCGNGAIVYRTTYSLTTKAALIAYIMQQRGNYNWWTYPDNLEGISESPTLQNHFYFDDEKNDQIIASYPVNQATKRARRELQPANAENMT